MKGVMEHCDDNGPWSIVMTGVMEHLITRFIEHFDDRGHGALC